MGETYRNYDRAIQECGLHGYQNALNPYDFYLWWQRVRAHVVAMRLRRLLFKTRLRLKGGV